MNVLVHFKMELDGIRLLGKIQSKGNLMEEEAFFFCQPVGHARDPRQLG